MEYIFIVEDLNQVITKYQYQYSLGIRIFRTWQSLFLKNSGFNYF